MITLADDFATSVEFFNCSLTIFPISFKVELSLLLPKYFDARSFLKFVASLASRSAKYEGSALSYNIVRSASSFFF